MAAPMGWYLWAFVTSGAGPLWVAAYDGLTSHVSALYNASGRQWSLFRKQRFGIELKMVLQHPLCVLPYSGGRVQTSEVHDGRSTARRVRWWH